jgi:hypothetical protein
LRVCRDRFFISANAEGVTDKFRPQPNPKPRRAPGIGGTR